MVVIAVTVVVIVVIVEPEVEEAGRVVEEADALLLLALLRHLVTQLRQLRAQGLDEALGGVQLGGEGAVLVLLGLDVLLGQGDGAEAGEPVQTSSLQEDSFKFQCS